MLNHRDIDSFSLNKVRDKIGKHVGLTSQESYSQFVQKQFSQDHSLFDRRKIFERHKTENGKLMQHRSTFGDWSDLPHLVTAGVDPDALPIYLS
jgi:hypothetical protein